MLNFVELGSHLGDEPSENNPNPFRKYQAAFGKMASVFEPMPLPSIETVFMKAVGLYHYLGPKWEVRPEEWMNTVSIIADAKDLNELREKNFSPEHYKKLRIDDGKCFLRFIEEARAIGKLPSHSDPLKEEWGRYLGQFYEFLIYRASSKKRLFQALDQASKNES